MTCFAFVLAVLEVVVVDILMLVDLAREPCHRREGGWKTRSSSIHTESNGRGLHRHRRLDSMDFDEDLGGEGRGQLVGYDESI